MNPLSKKSRIIEAVAIALLSTLACDAWAIGREAVQKRIKAAQKARRAKAKKDGKK